MDGIFRANNRQKEINSVHQTLLNFPNVKIMPQEKSIAE
jgi:hypothetical protein